MGTTAWENRKVMFLNFRQAFKLMKFGDSKQEQTEIRSSYDYNNEEIVHSLFLQLDQKKKEVALEVEHSKINGNISTHIWSIGLVLKYS